VYQQQQQQQQEQEQEQDAENPFVDPPFSRIKMYQRFPNSTLNCYSGSWSSTLSQMLVRNIFLHSFLNL
jgi:hypothetical protein